MAQRAILIAQGLDGWVRIDLGKGCVLKLRCAVYYAAIAAGKAERRSLAQALRERAAQATAEGRTLAWIGEEARDGGYTPVPQGDDDNHA